MSVAVIFNCFWNLVAIDEGLLISSLARGRKHKAVWRSNSIGAASTTKVIKSSFFAISMCFATPQCKIWRALINRSVGGGRPHICFATETLLLREL